MSPVLSQPEPPAPVVGVTLPTSTPTTTRPSSPVFLPEGEPAATSSETQESELQQTQSRISFLERLVQAKEKEEELLRRLGLATDSSRKRQRSESPSQESSRAIKVKNIIQFTSKMTFRRRQEWLQDLDRAFQGDPQRFQVAKNRILFSLEHMDSNIRSRWYSHRDAQPNDERTAYEKDWTHFENWTGTLVHDVADQDTTVMNQLERATQRISQSPWEFHSYLESLEARFPRQSEKDRSMKFFAKLDPKLREHLELYHYGNRPEVREEMVKLAQRVWSTSKFQREYVHPARDHPQGTSESRGNRGARGTHGYRGRHPRAPRGSLASSTIQCFSCGGVGHISPNCPNQYLNVQRANRGAHRGRGHQQLPQQSVPKNQGNA